jgi:hypothetical protein
MRRDTVAIILVCVSLTWGDDVYDDFQGYALSSAWRISFSPARPTTGDPIPVKGWIYRVGGSWLSVTDIEPEHMTDVTSNPGRCSVRLAHDFLATEDFQVSAKLSWDYFNNAEPSDMMDLMLALQSGGEEIVSFGFQDAWVVSWGGPAWFQGSSQEAGEDTLRSDGEVTIRIERNKNGTMQAFWGNTVYKSWTDKRPVDTVVLRFSYYPYDGQYGKATMGALSVDFLLADSPDSPFERGDANGDGAIDIGDPVRMLNYLFAESPSPQCLDAADVNNDGEVNIADVVGVLSYLFAEGIPPYPPFPGCGVDLTPDNLDCQSYAPCS